MFIGGVVVKPKVVITQIILIIFGLGHLEVIVSPGDGMKKNM